jgi:hypothetical protein
MGVFLYLFRVLATIIGVGLSAVTGKKKNGVCMGFF